MYEVTQPIRQISVNPAVAARVEEDNVILYDRKTGGVHLLNLSGLIVLALCCKGYSRQEILDIIKEELKQMVL